MAEMLRIATAGSVDDGKSTLIGRLLHDTKSIFEDQLESIERTSEKRGDEQTDLALLTDGLRAEREQGITIDVAYRYFATPKRKFVIADTPGHIQYTRNMVTGASTANLALLLIDARKGVLEQTRRHALLSSMLGVPHLVLCVNKMDLVEYDQRIYDEIREEFTQFAVQGAGLIQGIAGMLAQHDAARTLAHRFRIRREVRGEDARLRLELHQHRVDAVGAGAGHEADVAVGHAGTVSGRWRWRGRQGRCCR